MYASHAMGAIYFIQLPYWKFIPVVSSESSWNSHLPQACLMGQRCRARHNNTQLALSSNQVKNRPNGNSSSLFELESTKQADTFSRRVWANNLLDRAQEKKVLLSPRNHSIFMNPQTLKPRLIENLSCSPVCLPAGDGGNGTSLYQFPSKLNHLSYYYLDPTRPETKNRLDCVLKMNRTEQQSSANIQVEVIITAGADNPMV